MEVFPRIGCPLRDGVCVRLRVRREAGSGGECRPPDLLREEGAPVLEVYRRAEADVWESAAQGLTPEQLAQLKELINRWLREHPGQYYVAQVRFADMAAAMNITPASPEAKGPGSVF